MLLRPAGWALGQIAERRWRHAKPYTSSLPVICVGNFTAGGTGKTPLALELARILKAHGERPVFLTRGYGGRLAGPHRIDVSRDDATAVGDEALLLAAVAPVFLSRHRAAGARAIEAAVASGDLVASVILMDDGLQNPGLAKTLTLAVVDGRRGVGNGLVIPAGPLRAALGFQLKLADAIIFNGPSAGHILQPFAGAVLQVVVAPTGDTAWLTARPIVAFAGIGNPARFFDLLEVLGAKLAARLPFADHKMLSEADATTILDTAQRTGAAIVTTQKDIARLGGASGAARQKLLREARTLPIRLVFAGGDEARLTKLLDAALARHRTQRPAQS